MTKPKPQKPKEGQESVWDYPRPPLLERTPKRIEIIFNGVRIADSRSAWRVLETSHPPVYYIPADDIEQGYLEPVSGTSFCEWKGQAFYYDLIVNGNTAKRVAWSYPRPAASFAKIAEHFAFYAGPMDACFVDGEKVKPQPGEFYGGWITADIVGPFKGEPGSWGW